MGKKWKKLLLARRNAAPAAAVETERNASANTEAETPVVEAPVKKVSKQVATKPAKKKSSKAKASK
jgi:hypothetical protein